MSVIIYGVRPYGTVDAYGGEHAETSFFHIYFVPLIPTGSHWITGRSADGSSTGYTIDMYGKSVVAGYARVWGPIAAFGTFVAGLGGNLPLLAISALAIAMTVWSWTWRNLRGEAAQRRSDFNLVAFETRCEPRHMPAELRTAFKQSLDASWDALHPDRTPNDIARHGTKDAHQAVIAYGLLRVAAAMRGRAGREEDADADRILDGAHSALAVGEGPYREGAQDAAVTGSLATVVQAMAAQYEQARDSAPEARADRLARARKRSRTQLVGLILATPVALGAIALFVESIQPAREVTLAQLRGMRPPLNKTVRVTCDSIEGPLWEEIDSRNNVDARIGMCVLGNYVMAVRIAEDDALPAKVIHGKLREINDQHIWVREGLRADAELDAHSLEVYVDSTDPYDRIITGVFGLALALGVPVLWVLWFRARRRRKAELAAL